MLTAEAFKVIYDDYLESGLSIRSYCSNQRINEAKFFYWQRRLKNQLAPARGFVPLVIDNGLNNHRRLNPTNRAAQPDAGPDKASFCEITYPNGVTLKLRGDADLETLRSLLFLAR